MNKLAPLALLLLLFFGGALWYLANSELNANIRGRIIDVSNYYTDQTLTIDKVAIDLTSGSGEIYGVKLQNPTNFKHKNMLEISQISFTFDAKSISSGLIHIQHITLNDSHFYIEKTVDTKGNSATNFSTLYQRLNDKIALIQDRRKQKAEPYLQVETINLLESKHHTFNLAKEQPITNQIIKKQTLNAVGADDGLPASLFGIEVLRKTIETVLTTQASTR